MESRINPMVVDDYAMMRNALCALLKEESDIDVVGEAGKVWWNGNLTMVGDGQELKGDDFAILLIFQKEGQARTVEVELIGVAE